MSPTTHLRLGTRGSALARWQAEWVAARLQVSGVEVELVPITTRGDAQSESVVRIGSPGVFTKELERALLDGRIDLAVHSLKDLPTEEVPGLSLAAVPDRASPFDVLVSREQQSLAELHAGAVVGTGSLRRRAQLLFARPDLRVEDIRGNVDTRLAKLREGRYDAVVLAEAGLERLGRRNEITERLPPAVMLPAVGQGALAIQARANDGATLAAVAPLQHFPTFQAITAERAMLAALHGGCLAPIGAWGRVETDGKLHLEGVVVEHYGQKRLAAGASGDLAGAAELGHRVARELISQGAAELIAAARGSD